MLSHLSKKEETKTVNNFFIVNMFFIIPHQNGKLFLCGRQERRKMGRHSFRNMTKWEYGVCYFGQYCYKALEK